MSRRLLLRLGTTCNNGCAHCTVADLRSTHEDRPILDLFEALTQGRKDGCSEVVFMRGEPTIRPDILRLVRRARDLGYGLVQLQTNGRMFATPGFARELLTAGMTHAEVSLYGPTPEIHDKIAQVEGAYDQTTRGIQKLVWEGALNHLNIPLVADNISHLKELVEQAEEFGVERIQFNLQRPASNTPEARASRLSLEQVVDPIQEALAHAQKLGVHALTEAIPLCILGEYRKAASDQWRAQNAPQVSIDDLHRKANDLVELRRTYRFTLPVCDTCSVQPECPTSWIGVIGENNSNLLTPL